MKKNIILPALATIVFAGMSLGTSFAASQFGDVTTTTSVPVTGTYRVWSRIKAPDTTNNSFTLQINGGSAETVGDVIITANTWTWVDYRNGSTANKLDVNLSAGNVTMILGGREPDVQVDRILLLSDSCVPSGTGDNCTTTTPPPPPAAVSVPFRMNAGGPAYTDPQGTNWTADSYSSGGDVNSQASGIEINGTNLDTLYQSERWGQFGYRIPITNGSYKVRLHFAEIFPGCFTAGCRVFNVNAENQTKLTNLDIYQQAGQYTALIKEFDQTVTDGELTLDFVTSLANSPKVSAVEVVNPSTTPTVYQPEDINMDGLVNILDFSLLSAKFGQTASLGRADINQDGRVNIIDFSLLAAKFGTG